MSKFLDEVELKSTLQRVKAYVDQKISDVAAGDDGTSLQSATTADPSRIAIDNTDPRNPIWNLGVDFDELADDHEALKVVVGLLWEKVFGVTMPDPLPTEQPTPDTITMGTIPWEIEPVLDKEALTYFGNPQWIGNINWSPAPVDGKFVGATVYTATINIVPNAGFTLDGINPGIFTIDSDGSTLSYVNGKVSITFAETSSTPPGPPPIQVITQGLDQNLLKPSISKKITQGDFAINTGEWSATLVWSPTIALDDYFDFSTVYTLEVHISANTGFTLDGVDPTIFTNSVAGGTSSYADGVVTITFPETEEKPDDGSWEMTYEFPVKTTFSYNNSGKISLSNMTGYDSSKTILTDELYDAASMADMKVKLYAKYVAEPDFHIIPFDNWTNPTLGPNTIQEWGYDSTDNTIYIAGTNTTGNPIQLKLIREAD